VPSGTTEEVRYAESDIRGRRNCEDDLTQRGGG
jgi:hypothetical protein